MRRTRVSFTVPKFVPSTKRRKADMLTREGAERLAATIERAWRAIGQEVDVRIERSIFPDSEGTHPSEHYVVRSVLRAGVPPRRRRANLATAAEPIGGHAQSVPSTGARAVPIPRPKTREAAERVVSAITSLPPSKTINERSPS